MNRACLSIGLAACCLLAGCSTQSVRAPAYNIKPGNVCVIQDSSNRKVAYNSVIKGLKRKGFSVKRVGAGQTKNCSRVFSCQSISRWQIANYTSNIHLQYWEHGKLVSEAKYDAPTNEINISKFISTESFSCSMRCFPAHALFRANTTPADERFVSQTLKRQHYGQPPYRSFGLPRLQGASSF